MHIILLMIKSMQLCLRLNFKRHYIDFIKSGYDLLSICTGILYLYLDYIFMLINYSTTLFNAIGNVKVN